ncbi:MAG: ATP-binding protein, partial [Coleofasciculaceae cyanobacterium]
QTQLVQLFQNLLANAIKFRQLETPKIEINVIQEDDKCLISISDNGIGIASEYFERIFVIFQRLHSRKEYPGTGLGLAVCQKIVERHGGKIWLESTLGVGTTFYFTLTITESIHNYNDLNYSN